MIMFSHTHQYPSSPHITSLFKHQFPQSSNRTTEESSGLVSEIVGKKYLFFQIDQFKGTLFIITYPIMLLSSEHTVKLNKRYFKILYLSAAFKDTFVFLGMPSTAKDVLVHCDTGGKILYQQTFSHSIDSFGMINDREVVVLQTRQNKISVLNLQTYITTKYDHQFMFQESDQSEIQTFSDTRLLCVKESGRYNDNRFKLSYYSYPLQADCKPVAVYESQDNDWTYEHLSKKGNNHSLYIWFKSRHDEQFQFKTFDLRDDPNGVFNHHKIKNTIGEKYLINKVECAVSNVWQIKRGQFLAVCISNKNELKCESAEGIVNNNFVIDLDQGTVREANFVFDKKHNDFLIDYFNLGPISMFRTFQFIDGKVQTTPVYYINNETEAIVAQDNWQCTYKTKFFIPGYDNSTIMEGEYENGDVDQFTLKVKKVMDPKEISLHFMLHINEQFADDLLQDALELLGYI